MNYNLFKKMKDLAEKQEKVIFEDQTDEFNNLMGQREYIRKEITANSRRYDAEMKKISPRRQNPEIKTISMEISEMIRSIQETDKKIEELVISRKDALLNDIRNIKKGQNAVKRYSGVRHKINRFLDRNG
jgi:uncharacterized membrane protein